MLSFTGEDIAAWTGGAWSPSVPATFQDVFTDTREVTPGSLFFAMKGKSTDGHLFVGDAFAAGAAAAVVERGSSVERDGPLLLVDNTLQALIGAASGYRESLGIEMTGVTGSVGKTTVKEMTSRLLSMIAPTACTVGNLNTDVGISLSLLRMPGNTKLGVFEIGISHPGELAPLCDILQPSWGVITNVGPAHIEHFDTIEAIAKEKRTLFEALPSDGVAFLSSDSSSFELLVAGVPGRVDVVTVSMSNDADYVAGPVDYETPLRSVIEHKTGDRIEFALSVPGDHNLSNAMLAIAVARRKGADWPAIQAALEAYEPLPQRWEVKQFGGVTLVNDAYNANPLSMRAAVATFAGLRARGHKWLVLAGMLELGTREKELHEEVGRFAGQFAWDGIIVVGEFGGLIAAGLEDSGHDAERITRCETNAEAAEILRENLRPGDAVLLKASRGMKLEEVEKRLGEALRK